MRRSVQRCSAHLTYSISSFASIGRPHIHRLAPLQRPTSRVANLGNGARLLHAASRRLQGAAYAQPSVDDLNSTSGHEEEPITKFEQLRTRNIVHANVVDTLTESMGLETMTEVQTRTINGALQGTDIIAQAKTGTGKTLAFLLPVLQNIIKLDPELARRNYSRRGSRTTADDIRALIVSPTRELAEQIAEEARKITRNTSVIVQTAVGGTQKRAGLQAIQRQGCHILVGTPGRLKDILSDPYTRVEAPDLSALVFDEADRLLDQGFWPEIQEIMRLLPTTAERDRQTMMFSATIPKSVVSLVRTTLKPGFQYVKCVQDDEEPTHTRVPQKLVKVNGFENALPTLIELCTKGVAAAQEPGARPFKAIVYFNSTAEVSLASSVLSNLEAAGTTPDGFGGRSNALAPARILQIHAKLTQGQRTSASEAFRRANSGILLSSDVTARGMDFPEVTHVIQMGLPSSREQYIHRIGRTARAGKEGEGWLITYDLETQEARSRLSELPLEKDASLTIPSLDLTRAADVPAAAGKVLGMYQSAIRKVSSYEKSKAYLALLGVYNWYNRKAQLLDSMNNLAKYGWGLAEPPFVPPGLAQKLGISRLPGVRIGNPEESDEDRGGSRFGGRGGRDDQFGGRGGQNDRFGGRDGRGDRFGGRGGRDGGFGGRREGDSYGRSSGRSFGDRSGGGRDNGFGSRGPRSDDPFA